MFSLSVYLHDIPLHEAQHRLHGALKEAGLWRVLGTENIALDENAAGRVLAKPLWARMSSPHYHAAAMDGFAVRADATSGAQPTSPVMLDLAPVTSPLLTGVIAAYVDTGDPLPPWADAVIPIEAVECLDGQQQPAADARHPASIRIRSAVAPWSHVRPLGEDIVASQLVLPAGRALRPADLGAAAAAGHTTLTVARKPRVAIIPTGTELVPVGAKPDPGQILEFNSIVLGAQVIGMGGVTTRYPIVADDLESIASAVGRAALEHDLILLNAGSSAGSEDYSARVIEQLGRVLAHGVAVRPGHPVILGLVERGPGGPGAPSPGPGSFASPAASEGGQKTVVPIIGVPGYPVSAALTAEIFVEPLLATWLGRPPHRPVTVTAQLTRKVNSPGGDADYMRVAVGVVGGRLLAAPLSRGAGVITSLVQADGVAVLAPGMQGAEAGDSVEVQLYTSLAELDHTIFCIGSHDLLLDLLAQFLSDSGRRLVSSNVGSQGGLIALRRGYAHLAGSHLLDPETGEYNISYIRQYMPGIPVRVITLARRQQGLMVRRGNPAAVRGLQDLARPGVRFVNRQRGAGTRVLLDYHLRSLGIPSEIISGYNDEEYTHLGVAAAVAGGRVDCALGIAAAAQALELEFIPLFQERYDLVMPKEHVADKLLAPLLEILGGQRFRDAASELPGYDTSVMGSLVLEDP